MAITLTPNTNTGGYAPFELPRDFVGYGSTPPSNPWPNDAKIAVCFVLNYEEGSEFTPWNGDSRTTDFLHEHVYHRDRKTGTSRDGMVESSFEYGVRAGLPRLLKLFKKFDWNFTVWACARALEVSGPYGRILAEHGHEIACHGNRWQYSTEFKGLDDEARHINQSFDRLQKATGLSNVPTAWFGGGGGQATKHIRARVHKARGVPLLYCSDTHAGDLPYYIVNPLAKIDGDKDEGLLMIPYSLVNNDHRFANPSGAGVGAPDDWVDLLKADFDYLYQEGVEGSPKMMTIAMHSRILGKPGRIAALRRFMEYIATKEEVWVTTRADMSHHWREKFPYEVVGPLADLHNNGHKV